MSYHVRRQIRDAVASALTGLATTGARVYTSRVYPLEQADMPCLLVSTPSENSRAADVIGPMLVERTLSVQVNAIAQGVAGVDNTLDQICAEVEVALAMPCTALSGLSPGIELTSTQLQLEGTAEQPVGRAQMSFEVQYFTEQNAPTVAH